MESSNFNNTTAQAQGTMDSTTGFTQPEQDGPGQPANRPSNNVTVYQTTGPDAYAAPIQAPGGSGPALNPRSCVTCRRRKVRCDKQMPCSNCRRALIPCVFPAPGRAPRQPRPKDPNAPPKNSSQREVELVKRLRKLEGIVEELSGQIEVESGGKGAPSSAPSPEGQNQGVRRTHSVAQVQGFGAKASGISPRQEGDTPSEHGSVASRGKEVQSRLGRLVLNDHKGSTRYVSNGFWAKLNDELDALREDTQKLTDEESDDSDYDTTPNYSPPGAGGPEDHHSFILGYRSADVDLRSCHPLPSHVAFLWSVYQENVEPLVKLLHVPTTDVIMRDARKNSENLAPGTEALVFAIYYSAVVSLEPEEVQENFNASKDRLLKKYRFALEQSLARANFLQTSELVVLQALTLFLVVVRRVDDSRFCWTMTSLVIRIAQGMGLHRDGSQFDLTPFETEMRRRVWWEILVLDLRSAEELGTELIIIESSFDTLMPLNIKDSDISPESAEPPVPSEGRSETAVALVRYEILIASRRFLSDILSKKTEFNHEEKERELAEVYQRVEHKFLKHVVDETDPLYWVAAMVTRIIMAKMCLNIYQSNLFPGADSQISGEIRERVYVAAIEIVELGNKLGADPRCKQYRWLFMTYTNWHAVAFNLIEICRRPWTVLVERSWEAVSGFDRDPVDLAKTGDHAAIFLPLRKLFLRARKHRETEIARLQANVDEARRLDFAERMSSAAARFGPIPGNEGTMERLREKWWSLIRPEGSGHGPWLGPMSVPPSSVPPLAQSSESPSSVPMTQGDDVGKAIAPGTNQTPGQMDFNHLAMDMVDDLFSQPNVVMSACWPHMTAAEKGLSSLAMDGTNPATDTQGHPGTDSSLRQQALALQAHAASRDDNPPPWLWSHGWGGTEDEPKTIETTNSVDLDMLESDFDWQDWGQSLQNFDMSNMQPPL